MKGPRKKMQNTNFQQISATNQNSKTSKSKSHFQVTTIFYKNNGTKLLFDFYLRLTFVRFYFSITLLDKCVLTKVAPE